MKPRNTTKEMHDNPMLALLTMSPPGGIERMEAQGQRELVQGESLPTEIDSEGKVALEAAGVVFGAPYPDDNLFCPVTLPKGWKKQATDHNMHSNLLDDKGRIRASIFYKAASYDRRADMYARSRYSIEPYAPGTTKESSRCVVKDGGAVIHDLGEASDYKQRDVLQKEAAEWLNERFPKWKDTAAYWD